MIGSGRRIPAAREVTLDQRRIFIFPSLTGLFFACSLLVMLLAAINFENNLSYALTFLLATLFIVATLHTYANLSGLTIRALRAQARVSRAAVRIHLVLIERSKQRDHYGLFLKWPTSSETLVNLVDARQRQGAVAHGGRQARLVSPRAPDAGIHVSARPAALLDMD
jgi:hypothetical protein